jgi:hypothetical protein
MSVDPARLTPEIWLAQLFAAREAAEGGVVRRKLADVDHLVGRARFLAEVRRRGFTVAENAGYAVVFCNGSPVTPLR